MEGNMMDILIMNDSTIEVNENIVLQKENYYLYSSQVEYTLLFVLLYKWMTLISYRKNVFFNTSKLY